MEKEVKWKSKRVTESDKSGISRFYCQMQDVTPQHCELSDGERPSQATIPLGVSYNSQSKTFINSN